MKILIVKTSSMGDVIHAMPMISDLHAHGLALGWSMQIDWLVEEGFADLPQLHQAVTTVIPLAMRRWRRAWRQSATWHEVAALRRRLRAANYDLVIDLQGLVKSALWVRTTQAARRLGFDRQHAREPLAAWAYTEAYGFDATQPAIERLRELGRRAFGYAAAEAPNFGLQVIEQKSFLAPDRLNSSPTNLDQSLPTWLQTWRSQPAPYVVFLHATSRAEKLWPMAEWQRLGSQLVQAGTRVVLPWGSAAEQQAAQALATAIQATAAVDDSQVLVAPRMSLRQAAGLLAGASGVVGVDTGLTHLACALDVPVLALYAATPAWRYGPYWSRRQQSLGADGVWPQADAVLASLRTVQAAPRRTASS